jgi:uncharacterized protein (UPF0332 family)
MTAFDDCVKKGLIRVSPPVKGEIAKELGEAKYDLEKAVNNCKSGDAKWAIIQAYYSMFHMTRAVLFSMGFKERSHSCLEIFLDKLVTDNLINIDYPQHFRTARFQREEADYHSSYSMEGAGHVVQLAIDFNKKMKRLIN